jgi:hypothetical protein
MPYGSGSKAEVEQRQKAARKHGVYAVMGRGVDALEPHQRGIYAELQEQLSTRQGTVEALKDAAINTIVLAQIAQSYCIDQFQQGKSLDKIALLGKLPAFWNSAGRAIRAYLDTIPDEKDILDLSESIQRAMEVKRE